MYAMYANDATNAACPTNPIVDYSNNNPTYAPSTSTHDATDATLSNGNATSHDEFFTHDASYGNEFPTYDASNGSNDGSMSALSIYDDASYGSYTTAMYALSIYAAAAVYAVSSTANAAVYAMSIWSTDETGTAAADDETGTMLRIPASISTTNAATAVPNGTPIPTMWTHVYPNPTIPAAANAANDDESKPTNSGADNSYPGWATNWISSFMGGKWTNG